MTEEPQIAGERGPGPAPPRAPRSAAGRALRWLLCGVVLCAVLLAGTAYRLTRGPISLPDWTIARIEGRISRGLAPRAVSMGDVALAYDIEAQALRLRLRDVALVEAGAPILTLPDARVALDGAALLRGEVRPRRVAVDGLALDVARDAEGRFSLAFGRGGGALPATWAEALETLDAALATPAIAELAHVTIEGVVLRVSDTATGLEERVEDGTVTWRRDGKGVRLSLTSSLRLGGRVARGAASLTRLYGENGEGRGARAVVSLEGVSLAGLAGTLPGIRALTLVTGEVGAAANMSLSEDGTPGPLRGRIEARQARLTDRPRLALDRAVLGFGWLPGSGRIALRGIEAASDDLSLRAEGQLLLEEGLVGPVQAQLRLGETIFDPEGLFDRRVEFAEGVIEARLTQVPLALQVGQAMVTGPSGTASAAGRIAFAPGGPEGSLRLSAPRMAVGQLTALWPPTLTPNSRRWFTENLLGGVATRATGIVRFAAGAEPDLAATFGIEGASFRFLRDMPAAREVSGAAQLDGDRLTLRLDKGWVPARRTADPPVAGAAPPGRVDLAGTTFTIPDTRRRPPLGEVELVARGGIGDILVLLDNPPFRLLNRLQKDRDLAEGEMAARVSVRLPLRSGNAPADIAYDVTARLTGVESTRIVPGRTLASPELTLTAKPGIVAIAGDMTLEGVPFSGTWSQILPPPSTQAGDPAAPPEPPGPLPEPGRLTGTARVDRAGLSRLGIEVAALELDGTAEVDLEVSLPQGGAPRLSATSDLRGLSVALPAVSWSKGRDRAAAFAVEATLGAVPEVTSITLDAPGLDAAGRIALREGGTLDRATFDRVDTGWFAGPVVLTGRGSGASPAISIRGGRADLRRALLNAGGDGGGDGGSGGEPAPLDIALASLTVTEGIALTDLRATLRGASGSFTGRVNGGAAVEGALGPDRGGVAVQMRGAEAGAVLRSAGFFGDARGGSITMTLRPTGQEGVYAGALRIGDVRVRNAPALASLLQALSVVGILEQLTGEGLFFTSVESDFTLRPDDILVRRASAVGPSMSITADGRYDIGSKRMDLQGVISPIYLVNGLFGALFARRDEGLFGFTYTLHGLAADPQVSVNPLSILTPGIFRDIFRKAPPS